MISKEILNTSGSELEAQVIGEGFVPNVLASVRIGNALGLEVIPNFCEEATAGKNELRKRVDQMWTAKTVGGEWVTIFVRKELIGITKPFLSEANSVSAALEFVANNK